MTSSQFAQEFHAATRQREAQRPPVVRGTVPHTEAEERRYSFEAARVCAERGFMNLARSYSFAAGLYQSDEVREADLARAKGWEAEEVAALWVRWHPEAP